MGGIGLFNFPAGEYGQTLPKPAHLSGGSTGSAGAEAPQNGDSTQRGNQGSVDNPPTPGQPSFDQDRMPLNDVVRGRGGAPPHSSSTSAPGGPKQAEHNPDPPRPKQVDGIAPPDPKRNGRYTER
jgi:hypothetical protein